MENQPISNPQDLQYSSDAPVEQNVNEVKRSSVLVPIALTFLITAIIFGIGGYFLGKDSLSPNDKLTPEIQQEVGFISSPSPSSLQMADLTPSPIAQDVVLPPTIVETGADLERIKFSLPEGWKSEIVENILYISPISGGGVLSVKVYEYPSDTGRREFFCEVTQMCIQGTTNFTELPIGNISGYMASPVDNSGGGAEYFGAKGNTFYTISSFNPPSPNEFEKNYKVVLSSFVF